MLKLQAHFRHVVYVCTTHEIHDLDIIRLHIFCSILNRHDDDVDDDDDGGGVNRRKKNEM